MISFCVSAGTISYYLAKGVLKYGKNVRQQVSSNEQLAKQIDQLEEESRKILDQISDIKVASPGGKGFLGGKRLNREQIRTWINFINKVSNGKASLKIVEKGDELYEQLIKEGAQAGFNPQTAQIVIKSGFTEFEIFHEVKHLEEYLKIGETDYIKGMARYGGSFEENLIRQYKRELYVYNRVMENSFKFNKAELKKSKNIISIIENSLKRNKIDYSQIKVD